MASARARLGAARRGLIKRQQQTNIGSGIISTIGTIGAFAAGQAKKSKTAWGEYEEGYKALGGTEPITKPKFGQKGFFKGPSGSVTIGKGPKTFMEYDAKDVRQVGSFLGSDTASALFAGEGGDQMRTRYLDRVAPGKDVSARELRKGSATFTSGLGFGQGTGGVGAGFGQGTGGVQSPDFLGGYTPDIQASGETISKRDARKTDRILRKQRQGEDPTMDYSSLIGSGLSGSAYDKLGRDRTLAYTQDLAADTDPMKSMPRLKMPEGYKGLDLASTNEQITPGSQIPQLDMPLHSMTSEEVKRRREMEGQWDWKKNFGTNIRGGTSVRHQPISYAKGGSFVTNGPQMIMVGDNPGGREAVNIVPLNSKKRESKENRSLLESLYENNRRRKTY